MLGGYFQSSTSKFECLPPLLFLFSINFNRGGIAVTPHENNSTKLLTLSHLSRRRVRLLSPAKLGIIPTLIIQRNSFTYSYFLLPSQRLTHTLTSKLPGV